MSINEIIQSMSINEIIQSMTLIVQLTTLIVIGITVIIAFKQLQDQHEWYRREKAYLYSSLYHPEIQILKKVLDEHFDFSSRTPNVPIPIEDIEK